jgi:hypothetical protein
MTAKEFFAEVTKAEHELYLIRKRQEHAIDMATRLGGMSEVRIRSTGQRSAVESAAVNLADLSEEMIKEAEKYQALIRKAEKVISKIPQSKFRDVLHLRYLCGHTWRTISDEMDYSNPKSVYTVHGYALAAAEKVLKTLTYFD